MTEDRDPTEDERRFGRVTKVREHEDGLVVGTEGNCDFSQ